jgi:hypothetical protein
MGEGLGQGNIKWLMERLTDSYLVWIGLWLISLLGNVSVLGLVVSNNSLSFAKVIVVFSVYIGLIGGMVFSVWRLFGILREHIRLVLALPIEDQALRDYIFKGRSSLSRFCVGDDGNIRRGHLVFLCLIHLVLLFLFRLALF